MSYGVAQARDHFDPSSLSLDDLYGYLIVFLQEARDTLVCQDRVLDDERLNQIEQFCSLLAPPTLEGIPEELSLTIKGVVIAIKQHPDYHGEDPLRMVAQRL